MSAVAMPGMTFVLFEPARPVSEIVLRRYAFQKTSLRIHSRAFGSLSATVTLESHDRCGSG